MRLVQTFGSRATSHPGDLQIDGVARRYSATIVGVRRDYRRRRDTYRGTTARHQSRRMIKRLVAVLALAVAVTACNLLPKLDSVPLLTWTGGQGPGCFPEQAHGLLTVDSTYGTDLDVEQNVLTSGVYVVAGPRGLYRSAARGRGSGAR
jgi:hypothetical protein